MKKAFTMAEVLITLTIIGIVAALTIPAVSINTRQQEYKTGLKKAITTINQVIETNIAFDRETPLDTGDLYTYLTRHMSIVKTNNFVKCSEYNDSGTCKVGSPSKNNQVFYTADGMRFEVSRANSLSSIKLHKDNINLYMNPPKEEGGASTTRAQSRCGNKGILDKGRGKNNYPCVITVDINGDKRPSVPKKDSKGYLEVDYIFNSDPYTSELTDVFNIIITDTEAIPFGIQAQRAAYGYGNTFFKTGY